MGRASKSLNNINDPSPAPACSSVSGSGRRSRQAIAIVSRTPARTDFAVLGAAYVGVCQTRGASLRAGLIPAPAPTSTASHPRQHAAALSREAGRRFAENVAGNLLPSAIRCNRHRRSQALLQNAPKPKRPEQPPREVAAKSRGRRTPLRMKTDEYPGETEHAQS